MQLNLFILAVAGILGSVTLLGFGVKLLLKGWKGKLPKIEKKVFHSSTEPQEPEPHEPTIADVAQKLAEKKEEI